MPESDDSGMTLIELLIAMTISLVIFGVIAASLILGLKSTQAASDHLLDSRDPQALAVVLPSDLMSVQPGQADTTPTTASGCGTSSGTYNVAQLTWSESLAAGDTWFRSAYRVLNTGTDWRLVRLSCTAPTLAGLPTASTTTKILVRNLRPVVTPADLPTVTASADRLTLTVTDASGYAFAVTGTRRTLTAAGGPTPPPPPPVAEVNAVEMYDDDVNGLVDRAVLRFSAMLPAGCTGSMFSVSNGPSGATLGAAAISATRDSATLAIREGTGSPDTSVGTFHVQFTPTAACDSLPFDGPPTADKAAPVVAGVSSGAAQAGVNPTAGKAEAGDSFIVTFSEPVTGVAASGSLVLDAGLGGRSPSNTVSISGLTSGAISLGTTSYFTTSGSHSATFPVTITSSPDGRTYTALIGACTPSLPNYCGNVLVSPSGGPMVFVPAVGIKDAAGNAARVKAANPVPSGLFKAF